MREQLLALLIIPPFLSILLTFYMRWVVGNFIKQVPCIDNERHIELFKQTVRIAMLGALSQLLLMFIPTIVYVFGFAKEILPIEDLVYVVVPAVAYLVVTLPYKRMEVRAQRVRVENYSLLHEYIRVKEVWLRRSFPIW